MESPHCAFKEVKSLFIGCEYCDFVNFNCSSYFQPVPHEQHFRPCVWLTIGVKFDFKILWNLWLKCWLLWPRFEKINTPLSLTASLWDSFNPVASVWAPHVLMQYSFKSYSCNKTMDISRQKDVLLRNVAGPTAAAGLSGFARWCPMAWKLSEDCHRAEWGHYTLFHRCCLMKRRAETIRAALRAAALTERGQTKVNPSTSVLTSQWEVFDIKSQLCCGGELLLPPCLSARSRPLIEKSRDRNFHCDSLSMNNSSIASWITNQWFWVKDQTCTPAELCWRKVL